MKYPISLFAILLLFASFTLKNNAIHGELTLIASTKTAASGGEVCVDVTTQHFHDILSMQYTLKWSPKVLKFKSVQGFGLPGLSEQNFGQNGVEKGVLPISWYDQNLRSISKPDGSSIYQVCFEVLGTSGQKSYVQFTSAPTSIEISNQGGNLLKLNGVAGVVKIR